MPQDSTISHLTNSLKQKRSRQFSIFLAIIAVIVLVVLIYFARHFKNESPILSKEKTPTGLELKTALPDQSSFPSGWKYSRITTNSGAVNKSIIIPPRPLAKCVYLGSMGAEGVLAQSQGAISYALTDALDDSGHFLTVGIGGYFPNTVERPFDSLQSWLKQCPSWQDDILQVTYGHRVVSIPGLGDKNSELQIYPTAQASEFPGLYTDLLLVKVNNTVIVINAIVDNPEKMPSLQKIAIPMIAKLEKL